MYIYIPYMDPMGLYMPQPVPGNRVFFIPMSTARAMRVDGYVPNPTRRMIGEHGERESSMGWEGRAASDVWVYLELLVF